MREIKFRGKRISNGEWVYGGISFQHERAFVHSDDLPFDNAVEVDPATVGQFTGLRDKKGQEIYEGDIITHQAFKGSRYAARFSLISGLRFHDEDGYYVMPIQPVDQPQTRIEVIGNVHENPGLLKGVEG